MTYTPNGIRISKTGRLLIPCKFDEIKRDKIKLHSEVAIVAYGGRINPKKIGTVVKVIASEPFRQAAGNIEIDLTSFEVKLIDGSVVTELYSDMLYPFENGQFDDVLNYKRGL